MAAADVLSNQCDITDVYWEWEANRTVRQQVRDHKSLFRTERNPAEVPHVNVKNAGVNYEALLPLAKRMYIHHTGSCGMVSIPALVRETLSRMNMFDVLFWENFSVCLVGSLHTQ